jgi:STE24 endopeptidase
MSTAPAVDAPSEGSTGDAGGPWVSHWTRVPADPADWFDPEEVGRGRAYNRPLDRLRQVRFLVGAAVTVAFVVGQAAPRLLDAVGVSGWVLQLVVVAVALEASTLVYSPWFDAHRELVYDKRWGLSNQTPSGFVGDQLKGLLVGLAVTVALVVPLYAVIRATDLWWLWGWLIFSGFTVLFGLLYPVVIAPLFNTFTPLDDERLEARVLEVAERAGLDIEGVLVTDASRRSRAGNAYVAGLGRTRRVVLFDTILEWPPELIEQVVAHELGHWRHAHLRRKLPVLIAAQLVMFLLTWSALRWEPLLDLAGVEAAGDPASLPLFLAVFPLGFVVVGLLSSWLSRVDERQADIHALEVLGDPDAFSRLFRQLAETNKADVDPGRWKRLNASHPPIAERLAMADAWERRAGDGGSAA